MTQTAVLTPRPEELPGSPGAGPVTGRPAPSWLARHPAWPVTALLAGFPLWWALGFGDYIFILLAIPMAARLYAWSATGNRKIRVPPGFGLWLLFLLVVVVGVATISAIAPGTLASPVSNRIISFGVRLVGYLAATAMLLFVGNLTERELPRGRLAWLLGLVGLYTIAGGLVGVFFSHLHFTSPLAAIVPNRLQAGNQVLQAQLHPAFAQLQSVLGTSGRPSAPFAYTNNWGNCLALLLPWLIAQWWFHGTRRQRLIALAGTVIAIVPIIYSLNRGLWIGLIFAVAYIAFRLAAMGRLAVLGGLIAGLVIAGILIGATPLQGMISQRLANGASDSRRGSLSVTSVQDAVASPIVGFGDTRHQQGSVQSVTIGRSAKCPTCGNGTIGGNGQLWLLLICNGFLGAALYIGFFACGVGVYWRDRSPYGLAGVLVILLMFIFMISYTATGAPLGFLMLSYAMLWKNARARRQGAAAAQPGRPGPRSPSPASRWAAPRRGGWPGSQAHDGGYPARRSGAACGGPGFRPPRTAAEGRGPGQCPEPGRGPGGGAHHPGADRGDHPRVQQARRGRLLHRDLALPDRGIRRRAGRVGRAGQLHRAAAPPRPRGPCPRYPACRRRPGRGRVAGVHGGHAPVRRAAGAPAAQRPPGQGRRHSGHGGGRAPGAGAGASVRGLVRHPARRRPRVPGDEAHRGRGQDRPVQRPAHRDHDRDSGGQRGAARAAVGAALRAGRRHRLVLAAPCPA